LARPDPARNNAQVYSEGSADCAFFSNATQLETSRGSAYLWSKFRPSLRRSITLADPSASSTQVILLS
jgi:hypothetical protein